MRTYKIFVINLDRSVSRWEKIRECLETQNLSYERVSAIDGASAPEDFLNKYYSEFLNKKKYYTRLSKPEIGCYISHLKVCERIVNENLDYGIVLEDDIVLDKHFNLVPLVLNSISQKWNYIKLIAPFKKKKIVSREPVIFKIPVTFHYEKWEHDVKTGSKCVSKSSNLISVPTIFELVRWNKPPTGTQAYAITREGAVEFLGKRSVFFRPIDVDLQFVWETRLDVMGLVPRLCMLSGAESEIGLRKKYPLHYPLARLVYKAKYAIASFAHKVGERRLHAC